MPSKRKHIQKCLKGVPGDLGEVEIVRGKYLTYLID